jgi:ATP-binding cassette subfamily B protein
MESGYETIIGERGVGISGGQRQRIALARALAAEPSVLVLDDTTSAVDTDTEAYIQNSLRNLPFECTKIIIAQRISSVKDADMIIIMENGGFCVGTHDTLVRTNAYYRELCELQNVTDLPAFEGEVREGGEA